MTRSLSLLVGLVLGVSASDAIAHDFTVTSNVSIRYTGSAFKGKVNSSKRFCEKWRVVKLRKFSGGVYEVIARTKTNRDGEWSISYDGLGSFNAVAAFKSKTLDGHAHKCSKAESDYIQP